MRRRIERLQRCITELEAFDPEKVQRRYREPEVMRLEAAISEALEAAFGHNTSAYNRYRAAAKLDHGPHMVRMGSGFGRGPEIDYDAQDARDARQYFAEGKVQSITLLRQAIATVEDQIADQEPNDGAAPSAAAMVAPALDFSKVFVVHGRDNETKNEVARFLERIGLEAIILHEQPNRGRHLLTKFQEEAEGVGFAVVLITPDDDGALEGEPLQKRARQNVVFELGFLIGKLGSSRVAALIKGEVVRPSDFDGVGYITLDPAGGWKGLLARELKAAHVPFDAMRVFDP
jgi:predicted nucleotide-binding protein